MNKYEQAQAEHNRLLRECPQYQVQGMMEVMQEEMMMQMPIVPSALLETPPAPPEPAWKRRQWGYVQQLRAEVTYLRKTLFDHMQLKEKKAKRQGAKILKGIDV